MFGMLLRGDTGQEPEERPRTPDTLKERGREELMGIYDKEVANEKGSEVGIELKDDISVEVGATSICD